MSTTTTTNPGSLLEGLDVPERPSHGPAVTKGPKPFVPPILKDNRLTRWCKDHKRTSWSLLAVLVLGGGIGAYFALRPMPQPDYAEDPMSDLLEFTLLEDEFNKLPVEKRWELLRELIARFSKMSADDSAEMAGWAALIEGDLREQMMKNASLLAIDMWDKFAGEYRQVPEVERGAFLDKTVVDFFKMMESLNPRGPRDVSDEQRLEEARAQAKRDQEMVRSGDGPTGGELGEMASFLRDGMGKFATPQAQQRSQQLMRDMTRHLRGQDLSTGKPK